MTINNALRVTLRRHPRIRKYLLPLWLRYIDLRWRLICAIRQPVRYSAGSAIVRLRPEGQIPELLWKNNFESLERDFAQAYLRPGMRVVNIGANVGLYTVLASALVGPEGEVHAFEPAAATHARLVRNIELNGCRNVVVRRAAISNASGSLLLRVDPLHPTSDGHRFVERIDAVEHTLDSDEVVEALTLDDYFGSFRPQGRPNVDFMIVDVEGAELAVLQGGIKTLTQSTPTMLLECSMHQEDTENLLKKLGYKFWVWNVIEQALAPTDFRQAARLGDVVVRREGWRVRQ